LFYSSTGTIATEKQREVKGQCFRLGCRLEKPRSYSFLKLISFNLFM